MSSFWQCVRDELVGLLKSGMHCLDAFLALMAERGHRPGPGESDPAVADAAAQACHDEPQAALVATPPRSGRR